MALMIHSGCYLPISKWSRICKALTRLMRPGNRANFQAVRFHFIFVVAAFFGVLVGDSATAQQLLLNATGNPAVVGNGVGKRAIWFNSGTVGGTPVDIVGVMTSTALDHIFATGNGQIQITSVNQDPHFIEFSIYQAGTYDINSNSGGIPVVADVNIQINDIDGPANEQVYANICDGSIEHVRIDRSATTYRGYIEGPDADLGTEVFFLAGDRNYSNQPISGLEILYPQTSTFSFGRTANPGFLIRLGNPTYDETQTYDLKCADFKTPILQDDVKEQVLSEPVVQNILFNDSVATENNNPPANNSGQPSEYAKHAVDLIAPAGAINQVYGPDGHLRSFDVIGEGTWSYGHLSGELTFTPFVGFFAAPTPVNYRFVSPIILPGEPRSYSAPATVSVDVGSVGLLKLAQLVDTNLNGYADAGEIIAYVFTAENFGNVDLTNVTLAETEFSGKGIPPVITFQAATYLSPEGVLLVGEKAIYTASYTLVPEDLDTTISNQARVDAQTPGGTVVSDYSDSENPGDGDGVPSNGPGEGRDDKTTIYVGSGPDRGDAPVTYGDPQHADTSRYWIGSSNGDGDASAQYSVDASGDDLDGTDDESDEQFPQLYGDLTRPVTVTVNEPVPGTGYLQAFVDFGGDGTFLSLGDQVATDVRDGGPQDLDGTVNGSITFPIAVPVTAVLTPTFARLRWSSVSGINALSTAIDGEVEDYSVTIKTPPDADRGDAPASYGDPQHIVEGPGVPEIYLGSTPPDVDLLSQSNATASGDDISGTDDEDGVILPTLYRGGFADITVAVNDLGNLPQMSSYLQAFIDFDGDGTFSQPGEQVALNLQDGGVSDKDASTNGSITFEVSVPSGATTSQTFARFRWSTDNSGLAVTFDGEVEDYAIVFSSDPPPFICDASLYRYDSGSRVFQRLNIISSGNIYDVSFQNSGIAPRDLNANWGYNDLDGYFYTLRPGRRDLYRLDASGNFVDLANVPNSAAVGSIAGDILPNGTMIYVDEEDSLQLVSLTTPASPFDLGTLQLSQQVDVQDLAYNPTDGFLYGINQISGRAFRVDANNGLPGSVTVTEFGPAIYAGTFGSMWFDEDGRLYGYSNTTNNFYVIDTVTGNATLIATGSSDEGGDSDAASCRGKAPLQFGSISGSVYEDLNNSDVKEGNEPNLGAGIRIDLYIDNGTPADFSDDLLIQTNDTLADGTYSFDDLMINQTYRIALDETDPDIGIGKLIGTSNPIIGISVSAETPTTGQNFGFDPSGADLEITTYAAAAGTMNPITSASPGDTVDWIVSVTNTGAGSPSGVKVIDLIPSGYSYVSDDAPATGDTYDFTTGLWFVDEILSNTTEVLIITTTVLGTGQHTNNAEIIYSSLPDPDSDPNTGSLTDDLSDQIADDDEATYALQIKTGERQLSGRIFVDNGVNGGVAHDATMNEAGAGHRLSKLDILDSAGAVLATPSIASDGSWRYLLASSYSQAVTLVVTPIAGYLTISENTADLPELVAGNPHDGQFTFTPELSGTQTGLNFGLVQVPGLTKDRTATVGRGQVVTLSHIYTATSDGDATVSITEIASNPEGAFVAAPYLDAACDGAALTPINAPISVTAEQQLCIVARVSAGSGAGPGSNFDFKLNVSTAFQNTSVTSTTSNTDEVLVAAEVGQVTLSKTVTNETQGLTEGKSNQGKAGDVLLYRIYLENLSDAPVNNLHIYDRTPPYTRLTEPLPDPVLVTPSLTCNVVAPLSNTANYEGSLEWSCSGSLFPNETGSVYFRTEISP